MSLQSQRDTPRHMATTSLLLSLTQVSSYPMIILIILLTKFTVKLLLFFFLLEIIFCWLSRGSEMSRASTREAAEEQCTDHKESMGTNQPFWWQRNTRWDFLPSGHRSEGFNLTKTETAAVLQSRISFASTVLHTSAWSQDINGFGSWTSWSAIISPPSSFGQLRCLNWLTCKLRLQAWKRAGIYQKGQKSGNSSPSWGQLQPLCNHTNESSGHLTVYYLPFHMFWHMF